MLVLNKKIIIYLSLSIILGLSITIVGKQKIISPVSSTPVSNHIIVLDAGHGKPDGGAVSSTGVSEETINLQIVFKVQELLEASNCSVILTRSDENGIYYSGAKFKKSSDLKNRVEIINSSNADCLISVHLNKISNEKYYGWQSFYQKNNNESTDLAKKIQNSLNYSIRHT